jgi:NADPH:quinone reductase-like Zn-dependent oxidoreductase
MSGATMKALVLDAPGAPFRLAEMTRPVPGPGQVLVRIHASSINPLDTKIRAGVAPHARHPLPAILGVDFAGSVVSVGPGAAGWKPGDEVYGLAGGVGGIQGSLAEYAAVDPVLIARRPANLSMRQAAALPLVVIAAWEGLVDRAAIGAGQTVLIQAGAGGVGHAAVQIARSIGARVFATGREAHFDYLRSIGAAPIDMRSDVASYVAEHTAGRGFDMVYDTLGGPTLDASFQAIGHFGTVVSCLGWGDHSLTPLSLKEGTYSSVFTLAPLLSGEGRARQGAILAEAAKLVEAGKLVPRLDPREFDLGSVSAAYEAITGHTARGKLVVSIG